MVASPGSEYKSRHIMRGMRGWYRCTRTLTARGQGAGLENIPALSRRTVSSFPQTSGDSQESYSNQAKRGWLRHDLSLNGD